jgi:hypothetical protein
VTEAKFMEIAGSGPIRIATRSDLKRREREQLAKRDVAPLEGTQMSLWNSVIPNWWDQNINQSFLFGDPTLADRVWVANRCQQLNSQQIASMPLVYHGNDEPAWVSSPDPHWYPNGLGDALHAIVDQLYGWGFSCQYVTDTYATGFPRTFTVLPSAARSYQDGRRITHIQDRRRRPRRKPHTSDRPQPRHRLAWLLRVARLRADGVGAAGCG